MSDMSRINANLHKGDNKSLTTQQVKDIYDDFIRFSELSPEHVTDLLNLLEGLDASILIDPSVFNHEVYSILTDMLKNVLKHWHKVFYLKEYQSFLLHYITQLLIKLNLNSKCLIKPIKKCLKDISKYGKYLNYDGNGNNLKHFSKLIGLYGQDEQIMNKIVKCLCSKYYIEMFQRGDTEEFLLLTCPTYWMTYKGPQIEEKADTILNTLLVPSAKIIKEYSNKCLLPMIHLLDLLNYSLNMCNVATTPITDQLVPITDALLSVVREDSRTMSIKSARRLLLTLIEKDKLIRARVSQDGQLLEKLSEVTDKAYQMVDCSQANIDDTSIIQTNNVQSTSATRPDWREEPGLQNSTELLIEQEEVIPDRKVPPTLPPALSIFASNENKNKEETTLIWYDKNIGQREDTKETADLLRQINDYVLICSNHETCLEYINQIKTEKVLLILSGVSAQDILDQVHDQKQIDSIYIFCMRRQKYEFYLNNEKYYKVIGIYDEHDSLLMAVQENIRHIIKQSQAAGLFDQDERSMRNLDRQLEEFKIFRSFKQVLLKSEVNREMAKREMIDICRSYYRGNKQELKNILDFEQQYTPNDAIYWYTRETFVYRLVNKALRTEDYEALLTLRFFIIDLCENLKHKYDDLKERQVASVVTSYRGLKMTPPEIFTLKHSVGHKIATNGYLSTSRSKDVAYKFAKKSTKRLDVETVMLEIDVDITKLTIALADVAEFSKFPREEEILFDFGASFTIASVDYNEKDKVWLVKLSSVSDELLINDIETIIKKYDNQKDMNMLLGRLLYESEQYSKCQKYFENLLNLYENDNENVAEIYEWIAKTYSTQRNHDKAITNFTEAFNRYVSFNVLVAATRVTGAIGLCYCLKNDKDTMMNYLTKAFEMEINGARLPDNHCETGRILYLLGMWYYESPNKSVALDYMERSLNIYENPSDLCKCASHDDKIAIVCESLARNYSTDNDYDKALFYLLKSLKIREKFDISVQGRQNHLLCLQSLHDIYVKIGNKRAADTYSDKYQALHRGKVTEKVFTSRYDNSYFEKIMHYHIQMLMPDVDYRFHEVFERTSQLLKQYEENEPQNYEKIALAYLTLGIAYHKRNDIKWALTHYEKALSIYDTYLPDDATNIMLTARKLCEIYLDQKDFTKSLDLAMKATIMDGKIIRFEDKYVAVNDSIDGYYLFIGEKAINPTSLLLTTGSHNHPDVNIAFCHQNAAASYILYNEYNIAIILNHCTKAAELYESYVSTDQVEHHLLNIKQCAMYCHFTLGCVYQNQENYVKSNEHLNKSLTLQENQNDYHICDCYARMALNYINTSEYDLSTEFLSKTCDAYENHIKSHSECYHRWHILMHTNKLQEAYSTKGQFAYAINGLMKMIKLAERMLISHTEGPKRLAACYIDLASSLASDKQYQNAIENYKKAIVLYDNDPTTEQNKYKPIYSIMSYYYTLMGKNEYQNAVAYSLKAIKCDEEDSQDGDKSGIAFGYFSNGIILYQKGEYDYAMAIIHKSLDNWRTVCTRNMCTPLCYMVLGGCYWKKLDYQQALNYTKTAIEECEKQCLDLKEQSVAYMYFVMATCLIRLHQYDEALSYAIKRKEILDEIKEPRDVDKATCHSTLALFYVKKQQYEKCKEHRNNALDICKQMIENGGNIDEIGDAFEHIGEIHSDQNELKKARKYYKKTLKYFKMEKVDNHPDIKRIENILDKLPRSSTIK